MLTIGSFSKVCMVSTKTLRHYDRMGLIKPAHLDSFTGYRYYDITQLKDMLFIQKLKEYGFALKEIKELLGPGRANLKKCMEKKYAQIQEELALHKNLLIKMQKDILDLEKGLDIMKEEKLEIKLVDTADTAIVSVRENIAMRDFDKLFKKLTDEMGRMKADCAGPLFAMYHSEEFDPEDTDLEIAFPVSPAGSHTRVLPACTCAMSVHRGEYGRLKETYMQIAEWIEREGCTISSAPYERYMNDPCEVPAEELVTEVYFPIKK